MRIADHQTTRGGVLLRANVVALVLGLVGMHALSGSAVARAAAMGQQDHVDAALARPVIRGAGPWGASGGRRQGRERWQLDVHRGDDCSIAGRVALSGSPLASAGNVQGQIEGRRVWGSIVDDQGALIADFTGMVTATGLTGSYRDRTGETGRWAWDGSLQ